MTTKPDKPIAPGLLDGVRQEIARRETIAAINRYHEAVERETQIRLDVADDDATSKWDSLATTGRINAERQLIRCILAWSPDFSDWDTTNAEKKRWPERGFSHAGKLYLAAPSHDTDVVVGEKDESGHDVMHLVVVDLPAIVAS